MTFVKRNLKDNYKAELIELLKEYVDYFPRNYYKMSGLCREIV
jgi:hypothetical protein